MRGVSAQSLGPIAPYVATVAIAAAIPFTAHAATAATIPATEANTRLFADVAQYDLAGLTSSHFAQVGSLQGATSGLARYTWDRAFPELVPDALVISNDSEIYQGYEPFIASEGWREIPAPTGPFMVEFDEMPPAYFDAHDLSTIELYEQE
jgi:hypothetical protein